MSAVDAPLHADTLRAVLDMLNRGADVREARATVALALRGADPRVRTVRLPEPFAKTGGNVTDWPCGVWSDGTVVYVTGSYVSAQTGPTVAGSILAAIEYAGGAR